MFSYQTKKVLIKSTTILCCFFFFSSNVIAQKPTKEEKKLLKKSRKFLAKEKYTKAKANYLDLVKLNPTKDVYNFEAGLSYYFSDFEQVKSIPLFETALNNSTNDTIPELQYYLGKAYLLDGQYEKSKKTLNDFTKFINRNKKAGRSLLNETNKNIAFNDNGLEFSSTEDKNMIVKNLGAGINTLNREYAPVYRAQDSVILFTSRRDGKNASDLLPYEDIYAAKRLDADNWKIVDDKKELSKFLPNNYNTKSHDAGIIYSADGSRLYTYKKDILWLSEFKDGKWGELKKLAKNINDSKFNVPSVSITQDGNTMFFVATRKEGTGGQDIYKSSKSSNGEWNTPELLGPEINTDQDEDAPFLSTDGKMLYFSSKGHKGIGGYDFYKSEIIDGKPSAAINMGLPLNSAFDDIYLIIDDKGETGFFSSDRKGGLGGMDIFSFNASCPNIENTEIKGIVYDISLQTPLQATITLIDSESNSTTNQTKSLADNGKFLLVAPPEKSYKLNVEAAGYNKQSVNINIPKQCEFYPLFTEIALQKFEEGEQTYQVATIRNSFFNATEELNKAKQNGGIDTSKIGKQVPFVKNGNDSSFDNDKQLIAFTRSIDTANTNLAYTVTSDTIKMDKVIADTAQIDYHELFSYNNKDIQVTSAEFKAFIQKAANKVNANGKIKIKILSSASRVRTKTFKSNIKLSSIRGDEAKSIIMDALKSKGITSENIVFEGINSIVSGPKYTGDYKNTAKYSAFQYVKISIK